jgi:hypothetical protein
MRGKTPEVEVAKREYAKRIDYLKTFNTKTGQKVLSDLMQTHGMLSSSFSSDPLDIAFREGERNVVLRILDLLKADPAYLKDRIKEITDGIE